jgi:RNA polymerase sigma factor (sigma-70 family)
MLRFRTEQDIIKGCQKGNAMAQKTVYEQYARKMLGLCIRYLPHQVDAEDALVRGFTRVFEKITHFKSEGSFEGWIRKIMVNECLMALRKNKTMFLETDLESVNGSEYTPNDIFSSDYTEEDLLMFIHQLPQGYQTVFNLYAIEGYSHHEISLQLGISENTSKSQLSRARTLLQKKLNQHEKTLNKIHHA